MVRSGLVMAVAGVLLVASMGVRAGYAGGGDVAFDDAVLRGRALVISHACGDCHGGMPNPAAADWLSGRSGDADVTEIGPFRVWPSNLTPDTATGTGRYTERQIFNALRYGLRPSATPDVDITSATPGQGNHPAAPDYLAPAMPWLSWRYLSDRELRDIAAYLKRGLRPVRNVVPAPTGPPDNWASEFAPAKIGPPALPEFPTSNEVKPEGDAALLAKVLRGRLVVAQSDCGACHGGTTRPDGEGWMAGSREGMGPLAVFQMGPFKTYPRNLTPDNTTGMGRFTERQIFNALRYGLRPGETPDVDITSRVPGQGNHPASPKYLAPPMPWPAWRHMPDEDLWAMAAYLKHGVRPVRNRVMDSEGPPDFWASAYTDDAVGSYPAPPFPTAREQPPGGR